MSKEFTVPARSGTTFEMKQGETVTVIDLGDGHPSCFDNNSHALKQKFDIIHPVNLFMYTEILTDGRIKVKKPLSKAGDRVTLLAKMDLTVGLAACSVSESMCNGGKCSSIKIIIG